jgi:hypothetical protein
MGVPRVALRPLSSFSRLVAVRPPRASIGLAHACLNLGKRIASPTGLTRSLAVGHSTVEQHKVEAALPDSAQYALMLGIAQNEGQAWMVEDILAEMRDAGLEPAGVKLQQNVSAKNLSKGRSQLLRRLLKKGKPEAAWELFEGGTAAVWYCQWPSAIRDACARAWSDRQDAERSDEQGRYQGVDLGG